MKLMQRSRQNSGPQDEWVSANLAGELWRINWREEGYPFCGIYAISPDNRWPTKIGISQNPVKRLVSLQTACWRRLDVAEYRYAASFNEARAIERKVHEHLIVDGKMLNGEWFDIRSDKALEIIEFSADVLGIEISAEIPNEKIRATLHKLNGAPSIQFMCKLTHYRSLSTTEGG